MAKKRSTAKKPVAARKRAAAKKAATTKTTVGGSLDSPVAEVSRAIKPDIKLLLAVYAGGRCEFPSCNKFLYEHHLTLTGGNFAEAAHIVGFRQGGPRGDDPERPDNIHDLDNLMLLCAQCHKLIDDQPSEYPRERLVSFKRTHEARVRHVTGLAPELRTVVVQLKSRINGQAVEIPLVDVTQAVAPRWPKDRQSHVIDLTGLPDDVDAFYEAASATICRCVDRLYERGTDVDEVRHISLFALAPIPLLVLLGARLSNKIPVSLFQRHRDTKDWVWKKDGPPCDFTFRKLRDGNDPTQVALILSLSGSIALERLPGTIDEKFTLYELTLKEQTPNTDFLRTQADLTRFEKVYRDLLAQVTASHPSSREVHLFPAVPAPIAVACGHQLLPKAHPTLVVYDYVIARGGFIRRLKVDAAPV